MEEVGDEGSQTTSDQIGDIVVGIVFIINTAHVHMVHITVNNGTEGEECWNSCQPRIEN
jgi:hypothetical protein